MSSGVRGLVPTAALLRDYLSKSQDSISALRYVSIGSIEEVKRNTNSSYVFRVAVRDANGFSTCVYVKWSASYAKGFPELPMDSGRVVVEGEFLRAVREDDRLARFLPEVLWLDPEASILIMTDVLQGGRFLHDVLDAYDVQPWVGGELGLFLKSVHSVGFPNLVVPENHQRWWVDVGFKKYMTLGGQRVLGTDEVLSLVDESGQATRTLLWADPMPKNIVVDGDKVRLMDFETVMRWDVAYDIGAFLGHFVLRGVLRPGVMDSVEYLARDLFSVYGPLDVRTTNRVAKYVAVFLAHRTDGIDPYDFTDQEKEAARLAARELFGLKGPLFDLVASAAS